MRCLIINNTPLPDPKKKDKIGGGAKSILGIASLLPSMGWEPHLVVPAEGQLTTLLSDLDIPYTIFPFRPLSISHPASSISSTLRWMKLMKKIRPTIIHANAFELSRSFSLAAGLLKLPFLSHVRFTVEPQLAGWTLRNLPRPNAFIFNSMAMKDRIWPSLNVLCKDSRAYVIHNAVDLEEFKPTPRPKGSQLIIGMVANMAPFKRHEDFLMMAAEMLNTRQDLEFWIVGDDIGGTNRRQMLENLSEELGLATHVKFMGHRLDIPNILKKLHLLVVPSQFEPFGRVIIEAMACGRPVIGSREGGIPEIIDDGINGVLVKTGDYHAFAKAALQVLDSKANWERMAKAAEETAKKKFSLEPHVRKLVEVYQKEM